MMMVSLTCAGYRGRLPLRLFEHQVAATLAARAYKVSSRAAVTVVAIFTTSSPVEEEGHLGVQNSCKRCHVAMMYGNL